MSMRPIQLSDTNAGGFDIQVGTTAVRVAIPRGFPGILITNIGANGGRVAAGNSSVVATTPASYTTGTQVAASQYIAAGSAQAFSIEPHLFLSLKSETGTTIFNISPGDGF
jgi:hypothetical protein